MKANELRIGNWVYDGFQHFQITAQDILIISDKHNGLFIVPVELTEEWLLKFGFEKDGDDLILDTSLFLLVRYNDDEFVHLKSNHLETIISIKYVHQLQNLYFALTGEEIKIK